MEMNIHVNGRVSAVWFNLGVYGGGATVATNERREFYRWQSHRYGHGAVSFMRRCLI